MGSLNAKKVAIEVSENVRQGKLVKLGAIMRKNGYSKSTSKKPKRVTETKTFKTEMAPLIEQLEAERQAILKRLPKVRAKAKYRDLIDGLDKTTKNIQLLGGKDTGKVTFSWGSDED
jgi:hypothetical protein